MTGGTWVCAMCFGNTRSVFSVQNTEWFGAVLKISTLNVVLINVWKYKKNVVPSDTALAEANSPAATFARCGTNSSSLAIYKKIGYALIVPTLSSLL